MNKKDLPEIDRIIDAAIIDEAKRLQTASKAAKDRILSGVLVAGAAKETAKHNFPSANKPARGTIAAAITRERLQWALTTLSFAVATLALVLLVSQLRKTDTGSGTIQSVKPPATSAKAQASLCDTAKTGVTMKTVSATKPPKLLPWDITSQNVKPMFVAKTLALPNMGKLSFRASEREYPDNVDLDSVVAHDPALGPGWKVADWGDLVQYSLKHPIKELIDVIHWTVFDTNAKYPDLTTTNQFWVRYNGKNTLPEGEQHFRTSTNKEIVLRHFFVTRFHHHVPPNFLPHAEIEDNEIVLGSWYDWKFRVLAVRKENFH
jgi:hypothetical protein